MIDDKKLKRYGELTYKHGTPVFVYSLREIDRQIDALLSLQMPFGYTPRYAMKANHHPDIVRHITSRGFGIDASSSYEAEMAIKLGVPAENIAITSQQSAHNLAELINPGVRYNATSLHQLEQYARQFPSTKVGVRINPGIGSGHSQKVNVGGLTSSFGIWHEYIPDAIALAEQYDVTIHRVHTHIGSGSDMAVWEASIDMSLAAVAQFEAVDTINLGGGFKVAYMPDETASDVAEIGRIIHERIASFADNTGKELHVELEPGRFLVAEAGVLLATVDDIVDTGLDGYQFMKLNTGMNDFMRPALYGAQHPIEVLNNATERQDYVVVGHCCESTDLLTPQPGNAEQVATRSLRKAQIGDVVAIGGVGAYGASMATHGFNSFPSAQQVIVEEL